MAKAYGSIITNIGTSQVTNAMLEGRKVNITHIAVGDGNGIEYMPTPDMTRLKREVWRGAITDYSKDADQVIDIYGIIPASVGNFIIREMAAIDSDGNAIVLTNSPPIPKITMDTGASLDLNIRIKIVVTNADVLEFKIDPNVTTASMAKVIVKADKVIGATAGNLAKLNELGNLVDAGVSWEEIEAWFTSLKENKANCYNKLFANGNISNIILSYPKGSFRVDPEVEGMPRADYWIVNTFTGLDGYLIAIAFSLTNADRYTITYNQGSTPKLSKWEEIPSLQIGRWNPTVKGSITAGNPIYTAAGKYCKLGNLIIASANILLSSTGGMAGNSTVVAGLPYAVKEKFASGVNYTDKAPDLTPYSSSTNAALTNIYVFSDLKDGTNLDVYAIYERS